MGKSSALLVLLLCVAQLDLSACKKPPKGAVAEPSGALAESWTLLKAFGVTVSGGDPSALASSRPSTAGGWTSVDAKIFMIYALGLFILNWGFRMAVVEPFARAALTVRGKPPSRAKVEKYAQSSMEAVFYGTFAVFGVLIVPSQEWAWPSANWWIDFSSGSHNLMRNDLRCYYILYASRYFQGALSVFIEHKRKDFLEMQIHHWVTVSLVGISYAYGWNRVGVIVMALLDPADVPLHVAKMCKYVGDVHKAPAGKTNYFQFAADRLFEFFAVVFFMTRLVLYPYVCWSAHWEATRYFPKGAPEWTCVALLETLLALQCYWFVLLVRAAIKMAKSGSVEDIRSDDDSDDEPPKPKSS